RREDEIRLFNHSIPEKTTFKALAVVCITAALIVMGFMSLLILEPEQDFLDLLFEAVSAACTVGLSRGVTEELQPASLRSEEHTSELQSRENLVCRLLLEKKKLPVREIAVRQAQCQ